MAKKQKEKYKWTFSLSHFILCAVMTTILMSILILKLHFVSFPIQVNNIVYEKDNQKTIDLIENIAWNISQSHEYKRGSYDCKNFSRDLVMALYYQNLKAYCTWGLVKENENSWANHQWVEIIINNNIYPIEATNGFFINNQTYISEYIILGKGGCVTL